MRRLCIAWTLIFSFASLLLTSTAGAASPDLIAYWPFDEARGKTPAGTAITERSTAPRSLRVPKVMRFNSMVSTTLSTVGSDPA